MSFFNRFFIFTITLCCSLVGQEKADSNLVDARIETKEASYPVSSFEFVYAQGEHKEHLASSVLLSAKVKLLMVDGLFSVEPEVKARPLADFLKDGETKYSRSAIKEITRAIVLKHNELDIYGVYAVPHGDDIDSEGNDLRKDSTTLRFIIWTSLVKQIRTISSGYDVDVSTRINNKLHEWAKQNSPIKGGGTGEADLLRKSLLDDYVNYINRHPGRRVDMAISSSDEPGKVVLDYIVNQIRPWSLYIQTENTGTESTDEWRTRLGYTHYQFTNNDDILSFDYLQGGVERDAPNRYTSISYDFPIFNKMRLRGYADYSEYTASDIGISSLTFSGESWNAGLEASYNILQSGKLFIDAYTAFNVSNISTEDPQLDLNASQNFLTNRTGMRLEKYTEHSSTNGNIEMQWVFPDTYANSEEEMTELGRINPDVNWSTFNWNFRHSFYLEPFLFGDSWKDKSTWYSSTLAHELVFTFNGQQSLGNRLIPQYQRALGGFYSIRGYDESEVIGDNMFVVSGEYLFHLPRMLKPGSPLDIFGKSFKYRPSQVFDHPEWDFIIRLFADYGQTSIVDAESTEFDQTLASTGVGFEVRLGDHFIGRIDYGVAMKDVEVTSTQEGTEKGDSRVHMSFTVLF
ncbi:MAG: hypothetical protein NE330_08165 [Lentisphaeraceae bacterium]|nr:hypothetical protein [Lentisphaeraceae bacterium]